MEAKAKNSSTKFKIPTNNTQKNKMMNLEILSTNKPTLLTKRK